MDRDRHSRGQGYGYRRDRSPRRDRSRDRDITAPRRDPNNRISKPAQRSPQRSGQSSAYGNGNTQRRHNPTEDEQTAKWVSEEDSFVLKQAKKKAQIRVREGRAKPIDWLAVILRVIDPDRDLLDDDEDEVATEVVDPEGVFEGLSESHLEELEGEIQSYITLETNKRNREYWDTMKVICRDRRQKLKPRYPSERDVGTVAADVDKLLGPKSYEQLEQLEKQIRAKLRSDEDIDESYWEQLLKSLLVWKAKAKLKKVYQSILDSRLDALKKRAAAEAEAVREEYRRMIESRRTVPVVDGNSNEDALDVAANTQTIAKQPQQSSLQYSRLLDPEPLLKLGINDKASAVVGEKDFLEQLTQQRIKTLKLGYVPLPHTVGNDKIVKRTVAAATGSKTVSLHPPGTQRFSTAGNEDSSQATKALYEREVARGIDENEEIFATEESLPSQSTLQWAANYRPRKPKYFNRMQMGYEWNKYNQTHYDQDNPPPKVVQGYKFNIFYPDLIDKTKAPTFKIIRENGRRRGETNAAPGEEDTCIIRFIAGAPYEDIAFRIVDREWDYSAKRERGFKSSFDKVRAYSLFTRRLMPQSLAKWQVDVSRARLWLCYVRDS